MNKIFKVVKSQKGNVVASELAKGAGKGSKLTVAALTVLFGAVLSQSALATPVSIQGTATSENAVSIGTDSFATSVDGVAGGKGSVATGQGFTREEFAVKKQENQAAIDAVNGKQAEINGKNNDLTVAKEAIKQLDGEIDQLAKNQQAITDKINQKNQLENQKNGVQDQVNQKQNELNDAKAKLDSISLNGKNLLLNFTDILKTLNWDSMDGSDNSKNVLANELKEKVTRAVPEIASKYDDQKYRSIIDGYLNRQGSYQGSKEYVAGTLETNVLGSFKQDGNLKDEVVNNGFFEKSLTDTSYLGFDDNYTNQMEDGKYISDLNVRDRYSKIPNALEMDFEYNFNAFGRVLDENNNWRANSDYAGLDEKGRFTSRTFDYVGEDGRYKGKAFSKEGFNQKTLNTAILRNESIKKAKATGELNLLVESVGEATFLKQKTNLSNTFSEDYNKAMLKNHSMYSRVLFGVKKTDGTVGKLFNIDKNIGILSRLKDYSVNSSNLISTEDIANFKKWFKSLKDYDASIDWNFDKSAINLTDYKQNLNKVIAYNSKIDEILDIYQSIIDERKKSAPDTVKIDNETKRLMALKDEVIGGVTDMSNYVAGITPTYNKQWADYYLNYGKAEADKVVSRINNELKLYNEKDELVVDATTKAKEIQDAYDKADKALKDKKAELDEVNKRIEDLNLTPSEEKNDEVKRAKEAEKAEREADKARLEDEIKKGEDELAGLKEKLGKSSLKDLGLRSQAHGSNAFASGDDSIAMGTNATVTKADGIAIGQNTNVTGVQSIAIGKDSTVSGEKSIAIGVGHNVSGNHSTTIGDPNVVSGNESFVAGNNNNVASNSVMVMGNNVTVAQGFDGAVVLGADSAAAKANPTSKYEIKGQEYTFAGVNPTSTVSVGAEGKERQITNVAAGRISDTSTDAINGSQLYALADAIAKKAVTPNDVSDEVTNQLETKLVAGDNVQINKDEATKTFTISATDTNTQSVVVAGNGVTVDSADNAQGTKDYTVSVSDTLVKAGRNVEVTGNAKDGFTVNAKPSTTVNAGEGVTVTGDTETGYTISATDTNTQSVTKAGNGVVVEESVNDQGTKDYTVSVSDTLVKAGDNVQVTGNAKDGFTVSAKPSKTIINAGKNVTVEGDADTGYTISAKGEITEEQLQNVVKQIGNVVDTNTQSVTKAGQGVTVTESDNDKGTKDYTVSVKATDGLTFSDNGDLKVSDTLVKGGKNVEVTGNAKDGFTVNAKGTVINAGDNVTVQGDADNGYTISATDTNTQSTSSVVENKGLAVTTTDNENGTKNYAFEAKISDGLAFKDDGSIKVKVGEGLAYDENGNVVNDVKINAGNNVKVSGDARKGYTIEATDTNTQSTVSAKGDKGINVTVTDNADGTKNYEVETKLGKGLKYDENGAITATAQAVKGGKGVTVTVNPEEEQVVDVVGVTTTTDDGKSYTRKDLTQAVGVKGDGKNIKTSTLPNGDVKVALADDVNVNTVTANKVKTGNVSMSANGVNAGGKKVTNVAAGDISETSTDAVNGSQLNQVANVLGDRINQNAQNINNVRQDLNRVENKVNQVDHRARKGIAVAGAMGMLPQPHISGKSMVSAATTNYRGEQALAVGYSRLSDNGKVIIKLSGAMNTSGKKDAMVGASVGYQW